MDMDLVYLWCDDADAEWSDMRKKYLPKEKLDKQVVCKGRLVQNDELKYSLRSVENICRGLIIFILFQPVKCRNGLMLITLKLK